jgi:hypothetical protein
MVGEPNRVAELLPLENSTSSSSNFQATSPKINIVFSCILHRARTTLKPRHQTDNEANKVVAIIDRLRSSIQYDYSIKYCPI